MQWFVSFFLWNTTYNIFCDVLRLVGWYRGVQYTADQGMPVKGHTQVEPMTEVKGESTRLAS